MNDSPKLFNLPKHVKESIDSVEVDNLRLSSPIRNQIEFVNSSLDDLIPEDHQVRNIWNYVDQMDLSAISKKIRAISGSAGRPAINPKNMLTCKCSPGSIGFKCFLFSLYLKNIKNRFLTFSTTRE